MISGIALPRTARILALVGWLGGRQAAQAVRGEQMLGHGVNDRFLLAVGKRAYGERDTENLVGPQ